MKSISRIQSSCLTLLFSLSSLALVPNIANAKSSRRAPAQQSEEEVRSLCSTETQHRLAKLELHGETRFSEFKFDNTATSSTAVDFAEIGHDKRRGRKKRVEQAPAAPQMGQLLTLRAIGKEKSNWRNLTIRCGVNRGKVATFTYEILSVNPTGTFPVSEAVQASATDTAATTANSAGTTNK